MVDNCWFINTYVILCLLAPFINVTLRKLTKNQYRVMLVIILLLFSFWKTFLPNPPNDDKGYGIITFVMLYCIAGYIRLHMDTKKFNPVLCIVFYIAAGAVDLLLCYERITGLDYNQIFIVAQSIFLFLAFRDIHIQSKCINYLAKSVIAVLIIHTHMLIRPHIFVDWLKIPNRLTSAYFILYYAGSVLFIWLCCTVIDIARMYLFKYTFDKLFDRIAIFNKELEL